MSASIPAPISRVVRSALHSLTLSVLSGKLTDAKIGGGCTTPLAGIAATGRDCSAIANVSSVRCVFSQCVVEACKPGYILDSISGVQCILAALDA